MRGLPRPALYVSVSARRPPGGSGRKGVNKPRLARAEPPGGRRAYRNNIEGGPAEIPPFCVRGFAGAAGHTSTPSRALTARPMPKETTVTARLSAAISEKRDQKGRPLATET